MFQENVNREPTVLVKVTDNQKYRCYPRAFEMESFEQHYFRFDWESGKNNQTFSLALYEILKLCLFLPHPPWKRCGNGILQIVIVLTAAISSRGSSQWLCGSERETRSTTFSC